MTKLNNSVELPQIEFPIEVFPEPYRKILLEYNRVHKFNYEYMAAGLLFSLSLAIGKIFMLKYRENWIESALLWIVICGPTGSNKTGPLSVFMKYFEDKDEVNFELYEEAKKKAGKDKNSKPQKRNQNIMGDFTPESIADILSANPRGVGISADEILSWTQNFNRYSQSGEESSYLSMWSLKPLIINRKNGDDAFVKRPYAPVLGGIQPKLLNQAFGAARIASGFFNRILFLYPEKVIKEKGSRDDVKKSLVQNFNRMLDNILAKEKLDSKNTFETQYYKLSEQAEVRFFQWKDIYDKKYNDSEDEYYNAIISKMEIYLLRISLILQVAEDATTNTFTLIVSKKSVGNAIKVVKYFESKSLKVLKDLARYEDPLANYPRNKQLLYSQLPEEFDTDTALTLAIKYRVPKRTMEYFIADRNIFVHVDTGKYEKKY